MQNGPAKIIFLDFDGPLRNVLSVLATASKDHLNPTLIRSLSNFCAVTGIRIVISSNTAPFYEAGSEERVKILLAKAGMNLNNIHHDWSCRYSEDTTHDNDIMMWLSQHPEVTQFAAIDDLPLTVPNLVRITDFWNGMKAEDFENLANAFGLRLLDIVNKIIKSNPNAGIGEIKKLPPLSPA